MGGKKYKIIKEGNWRFRIIDNDSEIPMGFNEAYKRVVLTTYSEKIAEICVAALNDNESKLQHTTEQSAPCNHEKGYEEDGHFYCEECGYQMW